jgi:cytochrome b
MSVFSRLRIYHAIIGLLATAAYLSEDAQRLHVWFGYGVAAVVGARLVLGLAAPRFLGKPHWMVSRRDITLADGLRSPIIGKGILVAIMACLLVTVSAGAAMHQKVTLMAGDGILVSAAHADDKRGDRKQNKPDKVLKEAHEAAANGLFFFVFLHVGYLMLMRRQYALAMVFLGLFARSRPRAAPR